MSLPRKAAARAFTRLSADARARARIRVEDAHVVRVVGTGTHVLVFEDDEAAIDALKAALRSSGARVSVARSVDDALRVVARERIDVVATDAMLPRRRACALLIALRTCAGRRARRIPVIQFRCA
jgi:PleD family two-component response regulator